MDDQQPPSGGNAPDTREQYLCMLLRSLIEIMANSCPWSAIRILISVGFPRQGIKGRSNGDVWDPRATQDGSYHLFVRPDLINPYEVAVVILQQLVEIAAGTPSGERFKQTAALVGLASKGRELVPNPRLADQLRTIIAGLPPYPHSALDSKFTIEEPRKQTTRMIKMVCPVCQWPVRTAQTHLSEGKTLRCVKDDAVFEVAEAEPGTASEPGVDAVGEMPAIIDGTKDEGGAPDDQHHANVGAVDSSSERRAYKIRFRKPPGRDITEQLKRFATYTTKPVPEWDGQEDANIDEVQRLVAEGGGELIWQETSSLI